MPDSGYGASLFDDQNARSMASAIGAVTGKLGELRGGFSSLGSVTESVLARWERHLDSIKQKLSSLRGGVSGAVSGAGAPPSGGGAQTGQGLPAPRSSTALVPLGSQWMGRPAVPVPTTGYAPALGGMPQGTAAIGTGSNFSAMQPVAPAPVYSFTRMANYGMGGFGAPPALPPGAPPGGAPPGGGYRYGPIPGGGNVPPGTTPTTTPTGGFPPMGPAAMESFPAAAMGAVNKIFSPGGFMAGAMQSSAFGTLASALGYGNATNLTRNPIGVNVPYVVSPQDAAGAAATAMNQMGVAPGSQNWRTLFAGAGGMQNLVPGLGISQAVQASADFLNPGTMNAAIAQGMNFKPGGRFLTPAQNAQQIIQRTFPAGVPSKAAMLESTQMGNELWKRLSSLGIDPNSPTGQYVAALGKLEANKVAAGEKLPADVNQLNQDPSLKGPYQAYQKAITQKTKTLQDVIPAFADASACLNQAATRLLQVADKILGPVGKAADFVVKTAGGKGGGFAGFLRETAKGAFNYISPINLPPSGGGGKKGGGGSGGTGDSGAPSTTQSTAGLGSLGTGGNPNVSGGSSGAPTGSAVNWSYANMGGTGAVDLTGYFTTSATTPTTPAPGAPSSGGGTGSPIPAGGDYNQTTWAQALLKGLGAPVTDANVKSLVNWENREGGHWHNTAKYNPLNTTQPEPGYTKTGTQGNIGSYVSWQQGLQATVTTLDNGLYNDIVAAFKSGQGLSHGSYASLGKWSGGGYTSLARGSMNVDRTQLALLHAGERVIPAAENFSSAGRYQRLDSDGSTGGGGNTIHLNFKSGSIVLQVPQGASAADMTRVANQFVAALNDPAMLAGARST